MGEAGRPTRHRFLRNYKDTFIKTKTPAVFEGSDIEESGICIFSEDCARVPDFAANLERELDRKPGLDSDAYDGIKFIRDTQFLDAYLGPLKRRTVDDGSPEEITSKSESDRRIGELEVIHLAYIAAYDWGRYWHGDLGKTLSEKSMSVVFFHCFALQPGRTTTVLTNKQSMPFNLVATSGRHFRSPLQVLPRLLVEVDSKPKKDRPEDLVRMLLYGAAIVRFANGFLDTFMADKNFVLFAIYIWDDGKVSRYSLFQEQNNPEVRCKETSFSLNTSVGRAEFVRQLYNLRHLLEREKEAGDTNAKDSGVTEHVSTTAKHGKAWL